MQLRATSHFPPSGPTQWLIRDLPHKANSRPVVRRIVRWVANVSHGKDDRRQTLTKAEFVEGGPVGPAPKAR